MIFISIIIFSLVFGIFLGSYDHKPKFKEGDCLAYLFKTREFEPEHISPFKSKVLKIGKTDYQLFEINLGYKISDSIGYVDDNYKKVECPKDLK